MSTIEFSVFCVVFATLAVAIGAASLLCFRRTGIHMFLLLGAILILWPWIETFAGALIEHVAHVESGRRAYVFPFSLMEKTCGGMPEELWTRQWNRHAAVSDKLHALMWLSFFATITIVFSLIARSLKRKPAGPHGRPTMEPDKPNVVLPPFPDAGSRVRTTRNILGIVSLIFGVIAVGALIFVCLAFPAGRAARSSEYALSHLLLSSYQVAFFAGVAGLFTGVIALRHKRRKLSRRAATEIVVVLNVLVLAVLVVFLTLSLQLR